MRGVWQCLLLAHVVSAITGPRVENDYDRRRETALGHTGFNEHQTRFGVNSPLQSFQNQPGLLSSPAPSPIQFQQQVFPQQAQLQQPYVPQFNNLLPTQNLPSNQNNAPLPNNNGFHFNQPANINAPVLQSSFTQQQNFRQNPPQNIVPQVPPTLPTFQNNIPVQNAPQFSQQIPSHNGGIGQQRPTSAAFLPTVASSQNQPIFSNPSPITIQPAPNLAPQNLNFNSHPQFNQNHAQIPFQPTLGQAPVLSNNQNAQIQEYYEQQSKENLEKIKELQERARIIQKHQEFVQKQQQKQQEKVEKLHEEFISKQATKSVPIYTTTESYDDFYDRNHERKRPIQPHETDLFRKAVELYAKDHPTTTTSTTTTTTTTTPPPPPPPSPRYKPRPKPKPRHPPQDRNKQKLYNDIKNILEESDTKGFDDNLRAKSAELLQKPDILKQLKVALAENPEDFDGKNFSSREISLNGQKFEVIRTTNPNLIPKGAIAAESPNLAKEIMAQAQAQAEAQERVKESSVSFEDLTKDVLPPGANFELVRQAENGKLEEVKAPTEFQNKKKVTFVFLEEQDDGSFKVKGVKANGQQTEEGPEVENILNKIKKGEIQLPGPAKISNGIAISSTTASPSPVTDTTDFVGASSIPPSTFVTTTNHGTSGHTNPFSYVTTPSSSPTFNIFRTSKPQTQSYTSPPVTSTERFVYKSSTPAFDFSSSSRNTIRQEPRYTFPSSTYSTIINTTPAYRTQQTNDLIVIGSSTVPPSIATGSSHLNFASQGSPGLVDILKESGLFATAKYLKQSGLDTILNETGPYTIFAPTDKAFRTLLVQLGGPDKAEEKFRDNPRLLSGLLLHHVIPGAFDIASLQDEMTGVSLAGTQLRVNQYDMHDVEWNEVKVTTINGARVLDDKKDIHIPQGIAHAVDRVMFPLPVGDLVQTLQADRDRRFTTFLKAVHVSGFENTLAASKTYTVFAPTDAAFARLTPAEISRYSDKAAAKALVARHVVPGTLYSAGMRYYQLRNSMEDEKPLTLQKNAGRIKVNNAQVVTHNIPATNGVIHAVDTLL